MRDWLILLSFGVLSITVVVVMAYVLPRGTASTVAVGAVIVFSGLGSSIGAQYIRHRHAALRVPRDDQ
ncbi:hypothetical protein LK09_10540 [Microbacterium mangrovi]|uniref:Uncharacterized protein n=1 Tax=Microbacterium mangrovi TaxID=1348253 RepID=A0A0B2A7W5_9MICO|nr:hypothetical protein [Microbacterium mangrovi]KHK97637.1 hypothetical protein LK09_10540 [Microbacterium mangrovi]